MSITTQPFITDIAALRRRAKEHMERGPVTENYEGNVQQTIDLLHRYTSA